MAKRNKTLPGPCKDVQEGYTEHGGCVKVTYYFDSRYKPVPRAQATRAIVHEYDEKERSVHRDYLTLDKGEIVLARPPRIPEEKDQDEVMTIRETRLVDAPVEEILIEEILLEEIVIELPSQDETAPDDGSDGV